MSRFKEVAGGDNPVKYEMRAPPRRRVKGEDADDQPVFLRKAFVMMSSCPPEIGGWSEKGDTVVVKDVKLFAEKIIPTAYKHNNFSSFVRQLNFYGFRKIKSENPNHAAWWEFRHPNFLKDQPHLLADIKRSVHYVSDSPNVHEMSDLKNQVGSLTDRIAALHDQIEFLTGAVSQIQLENNCNNQEFQHNKSRASTYDGEDLSAGGGAHDSGTKKRKVGTPAVFADVKVKNEPVDQQEEDGPYNLMRMCSIESSLDLVRDGGLSTGPELQSLGLFRGTSTSSEQQQMEANLFAEQSDPEDGGSWADIDRLLMASEDPSSPSPSSSSSSMGSSARDGAAAKRSDRDEKLQASFGGYYSYPSSVAAAASAVPIKSEGKGGDFDTQYGDLPHASIVPDHHVFPVPAQPAAAAVSGVHDLFSVLESLSPELKIRFVDQLAEVMGRQLTANMTAASAAPAAPLVVQTSDAGAIVAASAAGGSNTSPTQSFAQLTHGRNAPFHLPSGVEAPEIALPLASAALGAFMLTSLNSLVVQNQQQQQQQQQMAAANSRQRVV